MIYIIRVFAHKGISKREKGETQLKNGIIGKLVLLVLLMGVVSVVSGCGRSVPAGHRGVKTHMGKVKAVVGEGWQWNTPMVEAIDVVDCRTLKVERESSAASKDLQIVTTTVALNYRINPDKVKDFYNTIGYENVTMSDGKSEWEEKSYIEKIISPRIHEVVKSVTAKYTASQLIGERMKVKEEVEAELIKRLKSFDIIVDQNDVSITNFDFSPEFNKSIEEKQIAQQTAQKAQYELQQAETQKKIDITRAEGEAKANQIRTTSLTPGVLQQSWIDKWNGELPAGSSGNFLYSLPAKPAKE